MPCTILYLDIDTFDCAVEEICHPDLPGKVFAVGRIGAPIRQLGLWDVNNEKSRKLQEAVDELQEKYGKDVIHKGEST